MCTYGITDPPALTGYLPTYQERLVQHRAGQLHFCACPAGDAMQRYLADADSADQADAQRRAAEPQRAAQRRAEAAFSAAGVPARYAAYLFDGFLRLAGSDPGKRQAIDLIWSYFQRGPAADTQPGIYLYGPPAMGKTGCLSPLFVHLVRGGATGLWLQYNELMAEMRRFEDGKVDERMDAMKSVQYLFIDDLGDPAASRSATDYARDVLFRLIDHRATNNRTMFVTSNLAPGDIANQFHARIARRLTAACVAVQMSGQVLA